MKYNEKYAKNIQEQEINRSDLCWTSLKYTEKYINIALNPLK